MKSVPKLCLSTLSMLLILMLTPGILLAQEIPITTSSKEARNAFIKGREKAEVLEANDAAQLFDKAISLDPNFAMAYISRSQAGGGSVVARQNREKARSLVDNVTSGERHWILAIIANAESNRSANKEHLDELMKLYPKDKRVLTSFGFFVSGVLDFNTALEYFNKALEQDKNYAPALNQIGYTFMTLEKWAEAEKAFKHQIEVLPNSPNPYDSYAQLLLRTGQPDMAIAQYQRALEKNAGFLNALAGMGVAYCHKGDFEKAREKYRMQSDGAPNVTGKLAALVNMMNSYLYERNISQALRTVEEYRNLAQQEKQFTSAITSYSYTGWIHLESGNAAEASINFEKARKALSLAELPEGNRDAFIFIQTLERGILLARIHEFESARALIDKCVALVEKRKNPGEERLLFTAISILEREMGNYDKALEAGAKNPFDPNAWYQAGLTYQMKGDPINSRKMFEKVLNWNWNSFTYALVRPQAKSMLMQ